MDSSPDIRIQRAINIDWVGIRQRSKPPAYAGIIHQNIDF